jgi:hypothetical protein
MHCQEGDFISFSYKANSKNMDNTIEYKVSIVSINHYIECSQRKILSGKILFGRGNRKHECGSQ